MSRLVQHPLRGVVVGAITMSAASAVPQMTVVDVQAEIEGRSRLELAGNTALWEHHDLAAPGRFACDLGGPAEATLVGGVAWWPVWPDAPTSENRDCGGCTSGMWTGTPAALPLAPYTVNLVVRSARGTVSIVEQPDASNGYRVVLEFDDRGFAAAAWYDVSIQASSLTAGVTRYCVSVPNTSGVPALIDLAGSRSIAGNDTRLLASGCPANHPAIFLCGTAPAWIPFSNGTLCISPFSPGLMRLGPVDMVRFDGTLDHLLDMQALAPVGGVHAGSSLYFQAWFRDNPPGGTGSNLTDAIEVQFLD